MSVFTVVIPTFNNCQTLRYSISSVLNQSLPDFELFVVGDGCPADSKEIINDFCRRDSRVIFFDNPKGPRHGELYRHAALQGAHGRYVTYLSDDDLFLPHHLAVVLEAFEKGADFVHTLPVHVIPPGVQSSECTIELPDLPGKRFVLYRGVIDRPESLREIQEGRNFLSLSSVSHTRDLYRKLPYGWRTTPQETFTDLYMWQQFAALPGWRGTGIPQATVIHCAKSLRRDWSQEERLCELADWSRIIQRDEIDLMIERAALATSLQTLVEDNERIRRLDRDLEDSRETARRIEEQGKALRELVVALQATLAAKEVELSGALSTLQKIRESRAMRAIERLRRYPILKRVGGAVASFVSR